MLKLITVSLIGAASFFTAGQAAMAQATGSYCSASTTDGAWAFSFNAYNLQYNCNLVRQSLARRTFAPISNSTRGFFYLNGFNRVTAYCFNGTRSYQGYGIQGLQNAFNYTSYAGGNGCTFQVY